MWALYLVLVAVFYFLLRLWQLEARSRAIRIFRLFLIASLVSLAVGTILEITLETADFWTGWTQIISVSFVLSAISILIREYKPVHSRYPAIFVYMPLLLMPTFLLIDDSEILKDLLNMFLQGGAILVLLLLSATVTDKFKRLRHFPVSVLIMGAAFGLFWFIEPAQEVVAWLWLIFFSIAIWMLAYSMPLILGDLANRYTSR